MTIELAASADVSSRYFDFVVRNETGVIPATFWNALPSLGAPPPITLVQHGGPLHKRHEQSDRLAESLVQRTGGAVLLIDGPIHGQRRTEHLEPQQMLSTFQRYWREDAGIDGMVSDWSTALDAVLDQGWADPDRVAWLGVSMGTAYGIPVCAADDRIKAAALGMWGVDWGQGARLLDAARRMKTPALFQIKDQDQFFSTEGQRELFDALGSADKCLCSFPGEHSLAAPGQLDQLLNFVGQAFAEQAA